MAGLPFRNGLSKANTLIYNLMSPYVEFEEIILGNLNIDWFTNASDDFKEFCGDLNLTKFIMELTWPDLKNKIKKSKSTCIDNFIW